MRLVLTTLPKAENDDRPVIVNALFSASSVPFALLVSVKILLMVSVPTDFERIWPMFVSSKGVF